VPKSGYFKNGMLGFCVGNCRSRQFQEKCGRVGWVYENTGGRMEQRRRWRCRWFNFLWKSVQQFL